jgi:hypothetical protein
VRDGGFAAWNGGAPGDDGRVRTKIGRKGLVRHEDRPPHAPLCEMREDRSDPDVEQGSGTPWIAEGRPRRVLREEEKAAGVPGVVDVEPLDMQITAECVELLHVGRRIEQDEPSPVPSQKLRRGALAVDRSRPLRPANLSPLYIRRGEAKYLPDPLNVTQGVGQLPSPFGEHARRYAWRALAVDELRRDEAEGVPCRYVHGRGL